MRTARLPVRRVALGCSIALACVVAAADARDAAPASAVDVWVERALPDALARYRDLHAHPELSLQEERTAGIVSKSLESAGYRVLRRIGGHGVAGIFENGAGKTLLIRGDMDALPVAEETGLSYASRVRATSHDGQEVPVMHACGHDIHTTNLIATAQLMSELRALWSGTLVIVAQPAEELGRGARSMIEDGLFERVPRPDFTLALHVESELPAGALGYTEGWAFANVDAVDITLFGRGGHGARPQNSVDPIVAGAHLVTVLQTLVSRRLDPQDAGVVTVGSFQAGNKHNVIPDSAHLQLTVRSYTDGVRAQLLEGIRQIAADTCRTFQCPKPPQVEIRKEYTPALYNDPMLVARASRLFREIVGDAGVAVRRPSMGGEDFARYARHLSVPGLMFRLGATDPALIAASLQPGGAPAPSIHSSRFAPLPEPTLRTGITAMARLALDLLGAP